VKEGESADIEVLICKKRGIHDIVTCKSKLQLVNEQLKDSQDAFTFTVHPLFLNTL